MKKHNVTIAAEQSGYDLSTCLLDRDLAKPHKGCSFQSMYQEVGARVINLLLPKVRIYLDPLNRGVNVSDPTSIFGAVWMGRTDFSKYTIQADVYSAARDGKLGDAGVIGQRYRLDLMGAAQELKIISWISHEEKYKAVPYEWKANTWYTLKLQTSFTEKDGKKTAVLQGKVWPRDGKEPTEWTVKWEDEPGNTIGSPGLFGNAKDSEVFFDNVQIKAN